VRIREDDVGAEPENGKQYDMLSHFRAIPGEAGFVDFQSAPASGHYQLSSVASQGHD